MTLHRFRNRKSFTAITVLVINNSEKKVYFVIFFCQIQKILEIIR